MKNVKKYAGLLLVSAIFLTACQKNTTSTTASSSASVTATDDASSSTVTATALEVDADGLYGDYKEEDYNDDTTADTTIVLSASTATVTGSGATLKNNVLAITKGGTYALSGTFTGQIEINSTEEVHLILNGVSLTNETGSALNIIEAEKVIVTLATGTENSVADAKNYASTGTDDPTAAIYSKADLTFNGTGALTVSGNYKNAIQSKDDLTFIAGTYTVTAVSDGLKGKDKVAILAGTYDIETAKGDAIQSTNAEDAAKGFVAIDGGTFTIETASDGVQAENELTVNNATLTIKTTGDIDADSALSAKGLKAGTTLHVVGGTLDIDATDDALHSNGDLIIDGGTLTLSSGDDGIHAETELTINNGEVTIAKSYEGIEGKTITFNGGIVDVTASDDGVNASAGTSSGGMGGGGMDASDGSKIIIADGTLTVDAEGDGVDSNGDIAMTGGTVVVNGPTNGGNGALDYAATFDLTGGTLFAAGASGMAQSVSTSSTQTNVTFALNSASAGATVTLTQNGKELAQFTATKSFQVFTFSSADLAQGTLTVKVGTTSYDVTLSDTATSVTQDNQAYTSSGMGGGGMGGGRGGRQ